MRLRHIFLYFLLMLFISPSSRQNLPGSNIVSHTVLSSDGEKKALRQRAWRHHSGGKVLPSSDDYTRITIYPKKKTSEMTKEERIAVCYLHACLL